MHYAYGFTACVISALFYGSNLFPLKKIDVMDGMFYQYIMGTAIFFSGLILQLILGSEFEPFAILGGVFWGVGNMLTFYVVKSIGLAVGLLTWGSISMIGGWASGFFGILGVDKQDVSMPILNVFGVVFILFSITAMFPIKITKNSEPKKDLEKNSEKDLEKQDIVQNDPEQPKNKTLGFVCAIIAGVLYGFCFNFAEYLVENKNGASTRLIDYVFSHYCGIFITSTMSFVIYCFYKLNKKKEPEINSKLILPAFLSGAMWAIGSMASFFATSELSFVASFPITTIGPGLFSSICMVFIFKEIVGKKNYAFLTLAIILACIGIAFICLSIVI